MPGHARVRLAQMARYVWVVRALSPRDGGWVRMGEYFPTEQAGWEYIELFWVMFVLAGDYITLDVVRTIRF